MAKSGTTETPNIASTAYRTIKFTWSSTSSGNTTTINWKLVSGGSETAYGIKVTTIKLTINNKVYYSTSNYESSHTASRPTTYTPYGETIKSGSLTINHDADGNAQMNVSLTAFIYSTTVTANSVFALEKLATASMLALPTFELGKVDGTNKITVYQGKSKTTLLPYGHKLKYKVGNSSYRYITAKQIQNGTEVNTDVFLFQTTPSLSTYPNSLSFVFNPPESDYTYVENGKLTGSMILETYSSSSCSKLIGTCTLNMTIVIPSGFKPVISSTGYTFDNTAYPNVGALNIALAGLTTVKLEVKATCNSNTTFDTVDVSNGTILSYKPSSSSINVKNSLKYIPKNSGIYTYDIVAKDKKGLSSDVAHITNVEILPYDVPMINAFLVNRKGASTDISVFCNVQSYSIKLNGIEKNTINSINLMYREYETGEWTNCTETINNGSYVDLSGFDNTKKYEIKIIVTDSMGGTNELIQTVPKAETFIHFASRGLGLGIGKKLDYSDTQKRVEISPEWELRTGDIYADDIILNDSGDSISNLINPSVYMHTYGVDSSQHNVASGTANSAIEWLTYTSTNPTWTLADGLYRVTASIGVTGKSSNNGVATCKFCNGKDNDEQWATDQRTRCTVPIMNGVRSTMNVSWYFDTESYGNVFKGWFTIWCNTSWSAYLTTLTLERVSNRYTATS